MENSTNNSTGVRKVSTVGQLDVSRVYTNTFQKEGTQTAELRQTVVTDSFYPSKQIANEMQDNVFGQADFGFEEQKFTNNETRVSWIDVPVGTTVEQVKARLAQKPGATLYRVLSNHPTLTSNQLYAINNGVTTKAIIAENQIVRYPEGAENGNAGKVALDPNGKPQYRAIFFSIDGKADIDNRTAIAEDFYVSEAIKAELATTSEQVVQGQTMNL